MGYFLCCPEFLPTGFRRHRTQNLLFYIDIQSVVFLKKWLLEISYYKQALAQIHFTFKKMFSRLMSMAVHNAVLQTDFEDCRAKVS